MTIEWPLQMRNAGSRFTRDCAHREVNDRDPRLTENMKADKTEFQLSLEEEGVYFEFLIRTELAKMHKVADLALIDDYPERTETTLRAIARGDTIILGCALPAAGGRSGAPDVLIKGADSPNAEGKNVYFPADIKNHNPLDETKTPTSLLTSTFANLKCSEAVESTTTAGKALKDDSLILAHYWRLLQSLGFAPDGEPFGAIIGPRKDLVWRSLVGTLDVYDTEFASRLSALVALETGAEPQTRPIWKGEWCDACHWRGVCHERLTNEQDVSLIKGIGYNRAIALAEVGVTTWNQLARSKAEDFSIKGWPKPQKEIDHAKARDSGSNLPFILRAAINASIPRADVEIDFDMESVSEIASTNRPAIVYLWGALLTIRKPEVAALFPDEDEGFRPFDLFNDISENGEANALAEFWTWAQTWLTRGQEHNFSVKFYCYHGSAEMTAMNETSKRWPLDNRLPNEYQIADIKKQIKEQGASANWVDLEDYVERLIWPTENQGLKTVAKLAGATWDDADANGSTSVAWFNNWYKSKDPAQRAEIANRLLAYNRNDVEATAHVREWLNNGLESLPPLFPSITTLD